MIFTERTITVRKGTSTINESIILYRGDFQVGLKFTILDSKYKFLNGANLIESEKATNAQLAVLKPKGDNIFSEVVKCSEGSVTFTMTKEMIDELEEVGKYSFQIRLFDANKESRVSIPPVEFGMEVREPVASEDHNNEVNKALTGYSIAKVTSIEDETIGDTFNTLGSYNKTNWKSGDRITEKRLNKIEEALDIINKNDINNNINAYKKIDSNYNLLSSTKADKLYVDEQIAKKQLEGASVDTSVLVFKSELEPIKDFTDAIKHQTYSTDWYWSTTTGGINNPKVESDGEWTYVECETGDGASIAYHGSINRKPNDLQYVRLTIQYEACKNPFVGLGGSFYWPTMVRKSPKSDNSIQTIIFTPEEVPADYRNSNARIFVGDSTYGSALKFRFKFEYILAHDYKVTVSNASKADSASEADHALEAEHSKVADMSHSATNAGLRVIPLDKILKMSGAQRIVQTNEGKYRLIKTGGITTNHYWYTFHVRVDYNNIEDLNKIFNLNLRNIKGSVAFCNIVSNLYDWNPNNHPINIDGTTNVNIYNILRNNAHYSAYESRKTLYIMVAYQYSNNQGATDADTECEIHPIFEESGANVLATALQSSLKTSVMEDTARYISANIDKIPLGVNVSPIEKFTVRDNIGTPIILSKKDAFTVNAKRETAALGTRYAGVYIEVPYNSIDELDGDCYIMEKKNNNSSPNLSQRCILYGMTDWGNGASQGVIHIPTNEKFNLKEKLISSGLGYENRNKLYICLVHYNVNGYNGSFDYDFSLTITPKDNLICAGRLTDTLMTELRDEFVSISEGDEKSKYITCWGDSLTAGGGWTNTIQSLSGLTVYNGGTGGENVRTITARQGGDVMIINDITIPATTTAVTIATRSTNIKTQMGYSVTPLLQGGAHVNPCYIGDVKGTLRWTGTNYADTKGTWTFTRSEAGEAVKITRPTAIRTDFDINRNAPEVMIIFMGQNGGYSSNEDLINQHRLMIEHSKCKDFLVLGLSSGSAAQRKDYEDAMKKEFGRRFLSIREYASTPIYNADGSIKTCYGLDDAGLTPTPTVYNGVTYDPIEEIKTGTVPHQLLSDAVHYTSDFKTVIGKMVYKRMCELNML